MIRSSLAISKNLRLMQVPANTFARPTVTGCSPSTVAVAGGDTVTVTGTGFTVFGQGNVVQVLFGSVPAPSFTIASSTSLTAVAPPHAAGAVTLILNSLGGTAMLGSAVTFT